MSKVFISCRRTAPDQDVARSVYEYLKTAKYQPFLDTELPGGTKWSDVIDKELRACDYFLVLITKESIASDMVKTEVEIASTRNRETGKPSILPILLNYDAELPYDLRAYLSSFTYAFWHDDDDLSERLERMVEAMASNQTADAIASQGDTENPAGVHALFELTEEKGAPLPEVDPRFGDAVLEKGALPLDSKYYVERRVDHELHQHLQRRNGVTLAIKGSRQMGKSSLLQRARAHVERSGANACVISFQLMDRALIGNLTSVYRYFANRLKRTYALS